MILESSEIIHRYRDLVVSYYQTSNIIGPNASQSLRLAEDIQLIELFLAFPEKFIIEVNEWAKAHTRSSSKLQSAS